MVSPGNKSDFYMKNGKGEEFKIWIVFLLHEDFLEIVFEFTESKEKEAFPMENSTLTVKVIKGQNYF